MDRRGFLSALITAGVAAAADPERLLWTPGKKLISIPKPVHQPVRFMPVLFINGIAYPQAAVTLLIDDMGEECGAEFDVPFPLKPGDKIFGLFDFPNDWPTLSPPESVPIVLR